MQAPLIMSYHTELKARLGVIVANNDEFYALVCTPSIKWISVTPVDSSRLSIVQSAYSMCTSMVAMPRMFCGLVFY